MFKKHVILGVHITDRVKHATQVQTVLTEFGCNIKTRIGMHDVEGDYCAKTGLLLIEVIGKQDVYQKMMDKLLLIEGVEVQKMVFDHA